MSKTVKLGDVAQINMGQSPPSLYVNEESVGLPFLQGNAEFGVVHPNATKYCTRPSKVCRPGDILISIRAPVGALNRSDRTYVIGRGLAAITFTGINKGFGWHSLNFWALHLSKVAQGSTFEAIGSAELRKLEMLTFEEAEQQRIAEILDTLDTTIQRTEELIAKLEATKAGLLHDLLTRGLDENGKLRPSWVEQPDLYTTTGLGPLPKVWKVSTLGSLATHITSGSRGWARYYVEEGAIFLRVGNLTRSGIRFRIDNVVHVKPPGTEEAKRTAVLEGDVLISITADLGMVGVVPPRFGEAYINQHIALVRLNRELVNPSWVGHYLLGTAGQKQFSKLNDAGAKSGMNLPAVASLLIGQPHLSEQNMVAEVLAAQDARIQAEKAQLAKLQLLKRGLMEDLLTGRVRVTQVSDPFAANLETKEA